MGRIIQAPAVLFERGMGYVLTGYPLNVSKRRFKEIARANPDVILREATKHLFFIEGSTEQVNEILHLAKEEKAK